MTGKRRRGRDPLPARSSTPPSTPTSSSVPAASPVAVTRPKTRRELRAERKRQQRRRVGAAGVVAIVVAALAVVAGVGLGVRQATKGDSAPPPGQTTLLLSITAPATGSRPPALESALLAHDGASRQAVQLLLPGRVLSEVCGFGNQQFAQILTLPDGVRLSRSALGDLLGGVTVDGSWVLTTAQLSRLVDELGGIDADVDTNVVVQRPGGSRVLLLQRGAGQHLNGQQAAAYATYAPRTEDATANLVRLQAVLDGILAALPAEQTKVRQIVASLGPSGQSTLGADRLAQLLRDLAQDAAANRMLPTDLPVQKIDAGGTATYRVDQAETRQFVEANLAPSWPQAARGKRTRVYVQNGVGTPGLAGTACTRLVQAGYQFAGSGNADHFGFATSKVLVFNRSVAAAQLGNAVAKALRLPASDVAVSTAGQNIADVLVILGKDYKP